MAKFFIYPWAVVGDKTAIPETAQSDGSISYQTGFTSDYQLVYGVDSNAKAVPRYGFNELMYDVTLAMQQYQTNGTPDFITSVQNGGSPYPYPIYAIVRYDDGSGTQLFVSLVASNTTLPTNTTNWAVFSPDGFQPGDSKDYCGATAPAGRWFVQNGAVLNIVDQPRLAAAIGNIWGGDGITTFALPNAQRRTMIGSGGSGSGTPGTAVGNVGGAETHVLTTGEMPSHNHSTGSIYPRNQGSSTGPDLVAVGTNASSYALELEVLINNTGGGGAHTIMQPSMVVLKLIRY